LSKLEKLKKFLIRNNTVGGDAALFTATALATFWEVAESVGDTLAPEVVAEANRVGGTLVGEMLLIPESASKFYEVREALLVILDSSEDPEFTASTICFAITMYMGRLSRATSTMGPAELIAFLRIAKDIMAREL
jgi:hypothetical protein